MPRKSYVTTMPDKTGAFLVASRIIAGHGGNIVRVSYNKAVDLHTLFIDVVASAPALREITRELEAAGYLNSIMAEKRVIIVVIRIPDVPGAVLPVLKILRRYDINISYINSVENPSAGLLENSEKYQDFKMGLLVEEPKDIKRLLDEISRLYPIDIAEYDDSEKVLDNTIFYIRLANDMQRLLGLSAEKTMAFITESNRILQMLEEKGENPAKVFDYIRRFAVFISRHRHEHFKTDLEVVRIGGEALLYSIQPPCGSNTYVLETGAELTLIDTGYAIYADEMAGVFERLFPGFAKRPKKVLVTHADVDHCGLLSILEEAGAQILLNQKSADSLRRQYEGLPDDREKIDICFGYSRLSRIISGYRPPDPARFSIIGGDVPEEHDQLLEIGTFHAGSLEFRVLEGSGGHLHGEMVFACEQAGVFFTGDLLVNISGFSPERAEFNSLAPYLMTSVNVDSQKAKRMRGLITEQIAALGRQTGRPCLVCGGHGPVSTVSGGKLIHYPLTEKIHF